MALTSNLCKILAIGALGLMPLASNAQQTRQQLVTIICGEINGLMTFLNEQNYKPAFIGNTSSAGIQDSLWIKKDEFIYIRSVQQTGEGCMVSTGSIAYSDFVDKTAL